jgi:putative lipoic acid-binding regulatory protein
MSSSLQSEEFYTRFHQQLLESTSWPSIYVFKFIVPSNEEKINTLTRMFQTLSPQIATKKSSNGKYTSITLKATVDSPDLVIKKYKQVSQIEGIISL